MTVDDYAQLFKCLSEPVRLRILYLLHQRDELCVCELVDALGISQSVVSRHLAYLRNNGLLRSQRRGAWVFYACKPNNTYITGLLDRFATQGQGSVQLAADLARLKGCARACS